MSSRALAVLAFSLGASGQDVTFDTKAVFVGLLKNVSFTERQVELGEGLFVGANWLRERCHTCGGYVDQESLQPLVNPHELGDARISSVEARAGGSREDAPSTEPYPAGEFSDFSAFFGAETERSDHWLDVEFSDGVRGAFSLFDLLSELENERATCTQTKGLTCRYPDVHLWNATLEVPPVFEYEDIQTSHWRSHALTNVLLTTGLVVVDGVPLREGFCPEFGGMLSTVRDTEWGTTFNVRTKPDMQNTTGRSGRVAGGQPTTSVKKDLAYTGLGIGLHTDNPYRDPMPDFQLLHQIDGCDCGDLVDPVTRRPAQTCEDCHVENYFADGFRAALDLKRDDPEAFLLLSTIPVRWENNGGDGSSALVSNRPHIELQNEEGADCLFAHCLRAIRFSAKSGGYAPHMRPEKAEKFYAARRKFSSMIHSKEYRITFSMKPGQMVLFDNMRVLHARSAVHSPKKARFVQGCYINRDGLWLNYIRGAKKQPQWSSLKGANQKDFVRIGDYYKKNVDAQMVESMFSLLKMQNNDIALGQPVSLYDHNLQAASRAFRGGWDIDVVVMTLFHDVSESVVSKNHGAAAAALMEPYISKKAAWMLKNHEIFQGYYYSQYFDDLSAEQVRLRVDLQQTSEAFIAAGGRDRRQECCAGHEHYQALVKWCEFVDQAAFDASYPSLPLEFFRPMVEQVFLHRKPFWHSPEHPLATAITGEGEAARAEW